MKKRRMSKMERADKAYGRNLWKDKKTWNPITKGKKGKGILSW